MFKLNNLIILAGVGQLCVVLGSLAIPKLLDWRQELQRLEPLALSIVLCALGCVVFGVIFAPWWGLSGVAFAMAASKLITFWPIQVNEVRRIFRAANAAGSGP